MEALKTISTLSENEVRQQLEKNKMRHQINKVLHAHPSPMYWRAPRMPVDLAALKHSAVSDRRVNFYMGIPYCIPTDPPHCGFCLFPTEKYEGKDGVTHYLKHMDKEADFYKEFYEGATIEALYVGGGTPNLLAPENYDILIKTALKLFPKMDMGIEKTLEGIPQLFNEEKIKAIREAGFNRVSMGVQQLNEKLIKYSGRKQTRKHVFDAIELFHKYNLACNMDLIYGWPEQTTEDMISDLRDAVDSGIRHITHYELNIGGRSDFSTDRRDLVPSVSKKIEMFKAAKEYLSSRGFVRRTVYDWERPETESKFGFSGAESYNYENNLRDPLRCENGKASVSSMGGIGYAAVNIHLLNPEISVPAVSTMNQKSLVKYLADVEAGRLPIERSFDYQSPDLKLTWIFQASQEMKLNKARYFEVFGNCLYDEFKSIWTVLEEMNWVENDKDEVRFVDEGEFYIPTIQALLSKSRLDEISRSYKNEPQDIRS